MIYREFVNSMCQSLNERDKLTMSVMGLSGEVGELVDVVKKHLFYDKPIDRQHLVEELGDIRHYLELVLSIYALSMDDIESANMLKLNKRYPNGFTKHAALERLDKCK